MGRKVIDITGQRFGRLTVLEQVPVPPFYATRNAWWKCKCDCGNETLVRGAAMKNGSVKSCGCLRRETTRIIGLNNRRK